MKTARDKGIDQAQLQVLFKVPFWGPAIARLPVVWKPGIGTAATDGTVILWDPEFYDRIEPECRPTVLCHEAGHCLLDHVERMPVGGDQEVWNQACDHVVNLMLKRFSAEVMAKRLADPFPFPKPESAYLADPAFENMCEEQIYDLLMKRKQQGGGKAPAQQPGGGQPGNPGKGPGQPSPAPHSMPAFGQMIMPDPNAPADQRAQVRAEWKHAAINCAKLSEQRGDCPGALKRHVSDLVSTSVPWYQLLRSWLREQSADDWDFTVPAMEYSTADFIMPSMKSDRISAAVFATDTSGSINSEVLAQFQSEKQAFLDDCRPSSLMDIYCDSAIHKIASYAPGERISLEAPGGGGTDFRPVFDHIEKENIRPRCLVFLTDLYGRFPDKAPDYPTLWVTWSDTATAPFGEIVRVGEVH